MLYLIYGSAIINGIFSPHLALLSSLAPYWIPGLILPSLPLTYYVTSLIWASGSLMISGLLPACYERWCAYRGQTISVSIRDGLWLTLITFLTLPAWLKLALIFLNYLR